MSWYLQRKNGATWTNTFKALTLKKIEVENEEKWHAEKYENEWRIHPFKEKTTVKSAHFFE